MFKLEISTSGAAFCDFFTGDPNKEDEAFEVSRLLDKVGAKIQNGRRSGKIWDLCGNRCGEWRFDDDDSILFGITFNAVITAAHCNYRKEEITAENVRHTFHEILKNQLEDAEFKLSEHMSWIIQQAKGE